MFDLSVMHVYLPFSLPALSATALARLCRDEQPQVFSLCCGLKAVEVEKGKQSVVEVNGELPGAY